ncbi:RNA chaperone Hfq [Candidatus Finniella inopinata]|uniref:RNA-binding protein Hfq n=1 Tax=Candidatus Finniella inopinata TaxID=1696036 RepID=A0A4Q7DKZ8_9PROT|nr:RNA chaperone Hfq [Candidatus Finniella inopinata]RZI47009.1 RNA chaperone Hfq [Candidatus Finniella inopinata]
MVIDRPVNIQDVFLDHVRNNKIVITIFLINGVKLQGVVSRFDVRTILLERDGHSQLIYKHAVSTLMPQVAVDLFEE